MIYLFVFQKFYIGTHDLIHAIQLRDIYFICPKKI